MERRFGLSSWFNSGAIVKVYNLIPSRQYWVGNTGEVETIKNN